MKKIIKLKAVTNLTYAKSSILMGPKSKFIYLPLESKNNLIYIPQIKVGDYVYKGDVVAMNTKHQLPLHCSISGLFIGVENKLISTNHQVPCLVIKNDFQNKTRLKHKNNHDFINLSSSKFIKILKNAGITGHSGSDFPTYLKYQTKNPKYLLVNGAECEPYLFCDKALIYHHIKDILEGIDAIQTIMHINKALIVVDKMDYLSIGIIKTNLKKYPKIQLLTVPHGYPNGWERYIITNFLHEKYYRYPTEIGIITNNISTIYAIFRLLKYGQPLMERLITITGDRIKSPHNIWVNIGTPFKDLLPLVGEYLDITDALLIAGGPMIGKSLSTDEFIITRDVGGVMVIDDTLEMTPHQCIQCGRCSEVCPVYLIPNAIMENKTNLNMLLTLKPMECIECGLCSYICPAKINLREQVKFAKGKILQEKSDRHD